MLSCLWYKAASTGNTQNCTRLIVLSYNPPPTTCSQSHTVKTLWGELKLLSKVYEFKVMICLTGNHSKALKVSAQGENMSVCSGAAAQPCFLEKLQNKGANVTRAIRTKEKPEEVPVVSAFALRLIHSTVMHSQTSQHPRTRANMMLAVSRLNLSQVHASSFL